MTPVTLALAAALLGSLTIAVPETSAAPMPVAPAAEAGTSAVAQARLVCGPYRCFRRPGFRRYRYRRFFHRRFYHRGFRRLF